MGRREQIRGRLEAATPGPWRARMAAGCKEIGRRLGRQTLKGVVWTVGLADEAEDRANAQLIANAPSDLRDLLAVADAAARLRHSPHCATNATGDHPCDCTAGPVLAALDRLDNGGER